MPALILLNLAREFVGRKISDVGEKRKPGYRQESQGILRLKSLAMS
jgi:hypothetical protein